MFFSFNYEHRVFFFFFFDQNKSSRDIEENMKLEVKLGNGAKVTL